MNTLDTYSSCLVSVLQLWERLNSKASSYGPSACVDLGGQCGKWCRDNASIGASSPLNEQM